MDIRSFWGGRFRIFHFVSRAGDFTSVNLGLRSVRMQPVLDTLLEDRVVVSNQRELFGSSSPSPVKLEIGKVITDRSGFLSWVAGGSGEGCDLLYFFCHAVAPAMYDESGFTAPASHSGNAYVTIADHGGVQGRVSVTEMKKALQSELKGRPVVFLNACSSAHSDSLYGSPFVNQFMNVWRGRALIGTEWSVPAAFADVFSRFVLAEMRAGKTLIEALEAASEAAFEQGNLFPLIYTLYGRPEIHG